MEELVVELRPHKGIHTSQVGKHEVTHDQDILFINDIQAGYVGHKDGAHISLIIRPVPGSVAAEIKDKVDAIRLGRGLGVTSKVVQITNLQDNNVKVSDEPVSHPSISEDDIV